jgi:hypothetical protein
MLHRSRYLPPKKIETVKSLFSQLSLKKATVIRCRYSTELKKETVKSLPLLGILKKYNG